MVLQDTWLFDGTIKENIKYNKESITDDEILEALKIVGIDHFVKTLPKGINEEIDDSETISSGQKQLITIARGMLKNAPLLILDEATSNVDTRTEELVAKAMDKLTEGRTCFIIAHRLSTIKNADLILVMNEGKIVEQGTHEELMKQMQAQYELNYQKDEENFENAINSINSDVNELNNVISNLHIVGIGDSVMLGAVPDLYSTFKNGYFDAKVSRTAWVVNDILLSLKSLF